MKSGKTLRQAESRNAGRQEAVPETTARPRRSLRRRLALGFLALVAGGAIAAALLLPAAFRATRLREAYLPELEAITQADPANGPALALLGARQAEAGEFGAAAHTLELALASGEKRDLVWLSWAAALAASGDRARAGAALKLGLKETRNALALQQAFDRCKALPANATVIALADALCPDGPRRLAEAYTGGSLLNGYFAWQARRHPSQSGFTTRRLWVSQRPDDAETQRLWSDALLRNRAYGASTQAAERAVALAPNSPEAHLALGDVLMAQGASGKAGHQYIAALKLRPDWLPALLGLGKTALNLKLLNMGIDVYTRATKIAPNLPDAWIGLGLAQYNQKLHLAESEAAFEKAEKLAPQRTDFFADYANALTVVFKNEEAEAKLRRRLAVAPDDARCHFLLALQLMDHRVSPERNAEAEAHLRTALKIEPDQSAAHERLGKLLLQNGKATEAIPELEQAVRQDIYNSSAMLSLVRAYRQTGHTHEAEVAQASLNDLSQYVQRGTMLEDMVSRQPLSAKLHRQLAQHYIEGGQTALAQNHIDAARLLQSDNKRAVNGLTLLQKETSTTVPGPTSSAPK